MSIFETSSSRIALEPSWESFRLLVFLGFAGFVCSLLVTLLFWEQEVVGVALASLHWGLILFGVFQSRMVFSEPLFT